MEALLRAGANKEAANEHGGTALFIAAEKGHAETVEALFRACANKEAVNHSWHNRLKAAKENPLIVGSSRREVVALLKKAGAESDGCSICNICLNWLQLVT